MQNRTIQILTKQGITVWVNVNGENEKASENLSDTINAGMLIVLLT